MKKKTRKLIGNVLIWTALASSGLVSVLLLIGRNNISGKALAYTVIIADIALLIGGLWGMKE